MCARYETIDSGEAPFADYRLTWASPRLSETRSRMFPGYLGPVIRLREGERGLDAMRWGLIPFWAKEPDPRKFRNTFNARAETVDRLASFRTPFKRRRCLIPALSFVEFPVLNGRKLAHRVSRADGRPLMFAGLWDRCPAGDDEIYSFTIITTEPADGLRWLHHRIPVVLDPASQEAWLDPACQPSAARGLLISPDPDSLVATPAAETPAAPAVPAQESP